MEQAAHCGNCRFGRAVCQHVPPYTVLPGGACDNFERSTMIVFDGTEASAIRIRTLIGTVAGWVSVYLIQDALYVGGHRYGVGTSFDVVLPDEIQIYPPAPVKTINMEFKI